MKLGRIFVATGYLAGFATLLAITPEEWEGFHLFTDHHVDINVTFVSAEDALLLNVNHDDEGRFYQADESIFWIRDNHLFTLTTVPEELSTLGEPGDQIYFLRSSISSSNPDQILHGISGNGLRNQDLMESEVPVFLNEVSGPGDLVLWLSPSTIYWDTGRPEGEFGYFPNEPGGHFHMNWGFTRRGIHILTLETEGTVRDTGQPAVTEPESYLYMIDPRSHEWWQLRRFGFDALEPHAAMDHESPANGIPNLIAYAFDLDPHATDRIGLPYPVFIESESGDQKHLALRHRRPEGDPEKETRSDLAIQLEGSLDLLAWTPLEEGEDLEYQLLPDGAAYDGVPVYLAVLNETLDQSPYRFLRFRVSLIPE